MEAARAHRTTCRTFPCRRGAAGYAPSRDVDPTPPETLASGGRVHVLGAGPVGLMLTALLQSTESCSVRLYEKRHEYTRTRMVQLAPFLVADSQESYRADAIDGDSVEAVFDSAELDEGLSFRQSIPADLMTLLRGWALGFCPLNAIEHSLSDLIDARGSSAVQRTTAVVTAEDAMAMLEPGDILIDCTGSKSLLRDQLVPGSSEMDGGANTLQIRLEYALVITFLYGQQYDCNENCKYYKNIENPHYKFIPMVHRTHYDGSVSHVTGIVNISARGLRRDAVPIRRSMASRQLFQRRSSRWTGSSTRSSRKRRASYSATWRSSGYPSICIGLAMRPAGSGAQRGPATTPSPARRCSWPAIRPSALHTFSRFRWASSARCTWRDFSRSVTCHFETCSIAMSCTATSSGFASTCAAR